MGGRSKYPTETGAEITGPVGYGVAREAATKRFQRRLWRLINAQGWNQAELSRKSGIGKDVISTYVNGKHLPDPKNAKKLADAFDITVDELFPDIAGVETVPEGTPFEMRRVPGTNRFFVKVGIAQEMTHEQAMLLLELTQSESPGAG